MVIDGWRSDGDGGGDSKIVTDAFLQVLSTADILTCYGRKNTGVIDNIMVALLYSRLSVSNN